MNIKNEEKIKNKKGDMDKEKNNKAIWDNKNKIFLVIRRRVDR